MFKLQTIPRKTLEGENFVVLQCLTLINDKIKAVIIVLKWLPPSVGESNKTMHSLLKNGKYGLKSWQWSYRFVNYLQDYS